MRTLLALLLSVVCAAGANVYVRDGAAGANTGADWTNAHDDLPATLTRGDTYYVADGSYASYTFDDAESGTTLITIKKAIASDHGTETGWSSTYGDGTATFASSLVFARDYYVINGQTRNESSWTNQVYGFRVLGALASWPLNFPPGGDHISISYCDVGGTVGTSYGDSGFGSELIYFVENSGGSSVQDFTISHCYLHNGTIAQLNRVDTIIIEYCYFKDMWAKECIRGQSKAKNGIIRYCIFQDTTRDTGLPGETGTAVIAMWDNAGEASTAMDNWDIYGNLIFDTGTIAHTAGAIFMGGGAWAGDIGPLVSNVKIYNNTVVGLLGSFAASINVDGGSGNEVRNTIWYNCIGTPTATPNTSNNSEESSDPFVNSATYNFDLASALAGTSLSSPYNTDLEGTTRGSDGTFDRGAYEFGGAPASTNILIIRGRNARIASAR